MAQRYPNPAANPTSYPPYQNQQHPPQQPRQHPPPSGPNQWAHPPPPQYSAPPVQHQANAPQRPAPQYPAHSPYPHQPHVNGAPRPTAYAARPDANAAPRPVPPPSVPHPAPPSNAMQHHASAPPNAMQHHASAPPNYVQHRAPPMQQRPNPPSMRPLPPQNSYSARPVPGDVSGLAAGMQQIGFGGAPGMPGATGAPYGLLAQGMDAPAVTDPAFCPRPDLSGSAVAVRVSQGDEPVAPPTPAESAVFDPQHKAVITSAEPQACPPEIFVPVSTRCVRLTSGAFPMSNSLARKYGLPLGAVVQPLARGRPGSGEDSNVPVVNFGASGIVRCRRCRSYVNYTCKFTGGGRHWICTTCHFVNDVPAEYFSPLDERGYRVDAAQRPELHRATIELVAPAEYMVRPPMPPVYLFVMEVTPAAVQTNALAACIAGIKRSIDAMPNEGRTKVGIITFDSSVHFYSLKPGPDPEPSVSVVADISDMFLPTPSSLLAQLDECRPAFEKTLDMIASSYSPGKTVQGQSSASCLGAAIQGAKKALEFTGGRMVILAASRPTAGPGALNDRADMSLLNTNRERSILRPSITFYRQSAVEMSKQQICCDLFLCPPPPGLYMDLSTIAQLAKITGGEIFYAPSFDAPQDAPRLQLAVHRMLGRETGFESVMRIRATKSVRCTGFSGRFFTRSTDLLAMPGVDSDKAYSVQFTFDENTLQDGPFCIQVALLYTTSSGERRLRVHTVAIPTTNSLAELYMRTDVPAVMNLFTRMASEGSKDRVLEELKKNQMEKVVAALAKYRDSCQAQMPGAAKAVQLLLPNAMKLLPLYMHGLGRTPLLNSTASSAFLYKFDDKAALMHTVDTMNVAQTSAMLYPTVIPVYSCGASGANGSAVVKHPHGAPASLTTLAQDCGYVIDDGRAIILWIGGGAIQAFTEDLLGKGHEAGGVDSRILGLELLRRARSAKGRVAQTAATITWLLQERPAGTPVHVIVGGDQRLQPRVEALMCEDRSSSAVSYKDMLCEMQRQVAQKVSTKR